MSTTNVITVPPSPPNWQRYKAIFSGQKNFSILRLLQYETVSKIKLDGRVLDYGGGKKSHYLKLLKCDLRAYESVNIDPTMEPTYLTRPGAALETPAARYDTILTMNTLEHIYDVHSRLTELTKSLKPNGKFVCAVPFLFPVHGSPDDYFRPTASWYDKTFSSLGYKEVSIQPLIWGNFATSVVCSGVPGPFKDLRRRLALWLDMLHFWIKRNQKSNNPTLDYPMGYFVVATK